MLQVQLNNASSQKRDTSLVWVTRKQENHNRRADAGNWAKPRANTDTAEGPFPNSFDMGNENDTVQRALDSLDTKTKKQYDANTTRQEVPGGNREHAIAKPELTEQDREAFRKLVASPTISKRRQPIGFKGMG